MNAQPTRILPLPGASLSFRKLGENNDRINGMWTCASHVPLFSHSKPRYRQVHDQLVHSIAQRFEHVWIGLRSIKTTPRTRASATPLLLPREGQWRNLVDIARCPHTGLRPTKCHVHPTSETVLHCFPDSTKPSKLLLMSLAANPPFATSRTISDSGTKTLAQEGPPNCTCRLTHLTPFGIETGCWLNVQASRRLQCKYAR
jgi:hypothetical protein